MRNAPLHPLPQFAVLFGIAAPLLLMLCVGIDRIFIEDAGASGLLAAERNLFRDVSTSHELLERMIERDEVTWDPKNGVRIGRVLANLKRSDGPNVLLVGSSQLLVVRDDRLSSGIVHRVDKLLEERLGNGATVYNLSLGGMTLAEKAWVLEQAVRLIEFDSIIIGMTLWDSESDGVRQWLDHPRDPLPGSPFGGRPAIDWPAPANLNRAITAHLSRRLEETVPFFEHRTAIQRWLKEEAARAWRRDDRVDRSPGEPQPATGDALPVHYTYPEGAQESILARVETFLSTVRAIRSASGADIMILLTPFRQDPAMPVYAPPGFFERYLRTVERICARERFLLLDASSLLGPRHFGIYADGPEAGRIDVLHFDASGHGELAGAIEASPLFRRSSSTAG